MKITTVEDGFEYQVKSVFNDMLEDYNDEQNERKESGDSIETFSEWLWRNRDFFGEKMYNSFDEYVGIDEATEEYNQYP